MTRTNAVNVIVTIIVACVGCWMFVRFWGENSANAAVHLVIGWLLFLSGVLPRAQINWDAVVTFGVCFLVICVGAHSFLRWLWNARQETNGACSRPWKPRWSLLIVTLVLLMFVTGTAFIGVVHQVGWVAGSREKLTTYRLDLGTHHTTKRNLSRIAGETFQETSVNGTFKKIPVNGIDGKQGAHSWQTRILRGLYYSTKEIHFDLNWDHPSNIAAFQKFVPAYLNPEIGELRDARGFAVSHYAGNVRIFDRSRPLMPADVSDGASNTILVGECASDFKAWSDPTNLRDAAGGINQVRDGFGGPSGKSAHFAMCDGSVRLISSDIDRRTLVSLATPNSGEALPSDWEGLARQVATDE